MTVRPLVEAKRWANRLRFAVMQLFFRARGRFPHAAAEVDGAAVAELARTLGVPEPGVAEPLLSDAADRKAERQRRDKAAALRLLRNLLRQQGVRPAAIGLSRRHRPVRLRGNNRAENSHRPIRRWERQMRRFKSPGSAQQVLSIHAAISNAFNIQRHLWSRLTMRLLRDVAHRDWLSAVAAL